MNYDTMTIESLADSVFRQSGFKVNKADLVERITFLVESNTNKEINKKGKKTVIKKHLKTIKLTKNKYLIINKFKLNGFSIGIYANMFYFQFMKYMVKIE